MKWHIPIPYFPLLISFTPIKGGGGMGSCTPLAMPVPVVQLAFVNLGSKRGSEATEWGEGVFPLPTVGNFFVENSCMKTAFFCVHIIMPLLGGKLCEVAYTNPLLPLVKIYFTPIEGSMGHYAP